MSRLLAQLTGEEGIINPVLGGGLGKASDPQGAANTLATYIAILWQTALIIGGLALLVSLLMSGVQWVMSGANKSQAESAKERIMQSVIGMIVLMTAAGVSVFLSQALQLNLLNPQFFNNIVNAPK